MQLTGICLSISLHIFLSFCLSVCIYGSVAFALYTVFPSQINSLYLFSMVAVMVLFGLCSANA